MKNKKGFTLIELLAVIIIIGIVSLIAIPAVSKYLLSSKDTVYLTFEKSMIDAAKNKVVDCVSSNGQCGLPDNNNEQRISLGLLIEEGYIENMKDPDSSNFCDVNSYVIVKGDKTEDYKYNSCLRCGVYNTNNELCRTIDGDGDSPVCGAVTGESTRWTNQNRTITVGCTDPSSGCEQMSFSKTFNTTTEVGKIVISDRSQKTTLCDVNAYVDKTLPTCNIDVSGDYDEALGWYKEEAVASINSISDSNSGVLTYGIGTSIQNRDYNKQTTYNVGKGITTVIGYVKDKAGNEGTCSREIRVGLGKPEFNVYYGYTVYTTTSISSNTAFTVSNTGIYSNIEKVIIYLSSPIQTTSSAMISSGSMNRNATMQQGSQEIVFVIPKGTYNSFNITLGNVSGKSYSINRIEALTKDEIWTQNNIELYADPIDSGLRSVQASFDNGETWGNSLHQTFTTRTQNNVIIKNIIGIESDPTPYDVRVDNIVPTVSITATRKTSGSAVSSGKYSNDGLNFKFVNSNDVPSGTKIFYCKNTSNSCTPNIEVSENVSLTSFNDITTNYYIRYRAISNTGVSGSIKSYAAKFDLVKPVCTFENVVATIDMSTPGPIYLTCTDSLSKLASKTITASHFTLSNNNMSIQSVSQETITDGIKIAITLRGNNTGNTTISFKANVVKDKAANPNNSVSKEVTIGNNIIYPTGKTKETVVAGDIVSVGDKDFYVVRHAGEDLVLLLAEYATYPEAFSSNAYWDQYIGNEIPGHYCTVASDTNCAYIFNGEDHDFSDNLKIYLNETFGIYPKEVRIPSLEEANILKNLSLEILGGNYWLGTPYSEDSLWAVYNETIVGENEYSLDWVFGFRPVIVI